MLTVVRVLGEQVEGYFQSHLSGGRDCRLLVPGLTPRIGRQLHDLLVSRGINSYLVVGEDEQPDEMARLIRPIGLTSRRIGSFVAVANPGQLAHVQDSIRGTGGTIRSLAFSEEWPWIDDGNESFQFDGPVLDNLVNSWSQDPVVKDWMREFVLLGLLPFTRASSKRGMLLLEETLGRFDPANYPGIEDDREKLLFHAGVPRSENGIRGDASRFVRGTTRLVSKIVERCQKEEAIREQARDMVSEVIPESQQGAISRSIDCLLDGVGRTPEVNLGLLGFHSCWGDGNDKSRNWRNLSIECLREIFNIEKPKTAELTYNITCDRSVRSEDGKKLASFIGEEVRLDISCNIPEADFPGHSWEVRILNRASVIHQYTVNQPHETEIVVLNTVDITARYSKKLPLRLALLRDGSSNAEVRLDLHLCGDERPDFVVVKPGFFVVDATPEVFEETPDKKIEIDEPVQLFMFSCSGVIPSIHDVDGENFDVVEQDKGIWKSSRFIDVSTDPSGLITRICQFYESSAVICFEAKDTERGEFTVEDELRKGIVSGNEKVLKQLVPLFSGSSAKPYPSLGKLNDATRRKSNLATLMTSTTGWRPVVTDLLQPTSEASGSLGDFINHIGQVDRDLLSGVTLPDSALPLLETYSTSRDVVRKKIESLVEGDGWTFDHPVYATHPIFSLKRSSEIEEAINAYLGAYYEILDYIGNHQRGLEWLQLFVLSHLDCAVHWDESNISNCLYLVGPWHPLVLAKRFMVQAAVYARADRKDRKSFSRLVSLLGHVQGFRWLVGISADDTELEPVYVAASSDPGWHVAIKTGVNKFIPSVETGGINEILAKLRRNFGLEIETTTGASQNLATSCLSSYLRSFPSRRSIGLRVRRGYAENEVVSAIDRSLHQEDGETTQGLQLPGGVRVCFEGPVEDDIEVTRWSHPPLYLYTYQDDSDCLKNEHPDIYMLPPAGESSFKTETEKYTAPRGNGWQTVFAQPLNWLTEGQTLVPKSITYEFDTMGRKEGGIGEAYVGVSSKVSAICRESLVSVRSIELPKRLDAPWVVVPGKEIDPAILVKYVRDGADRGIQERALWDYKVDLARGDTSFYILSTIPRGFQASVNGFFGADDVASGFIGDLGRVGISIGGEALKSGRHALGVIGLVGAVRLLKESIHNQPGIPVKEMSAVGFLVPVDSFASFFGKGSKTDKAEDDGQRGDLLAIQIALPRTSGGKLSISCCGIESKFISTFFGHTRARTALQQARSTTIDFKKLVETSLRDGGMPERLALLELLKFGLRIVSPSAPADIRQWVDIEGKVYKLLLVGSYDYCDASHDAVLVSTEGNLPGIADFEVLDEGLWIRLTKGHWPGISDTPQLQTIRKKVSGLFENCANAPSPTLSSLTAGTAESSEEAAAKSSAPAPSERNISEPTETGREEAVKSAGTDAKSRSTTRGAPLNQIFLGVDEGRQAIYFNPQSQVDPLDNMNLMVTGSSGTGKTQLLKYLICAVRDQGKPVLVLDFKNDFASDPKFSERASLEQVFVTFGGLPYNPLIPYPVKHPGTGELFLQVGQHIAGVASVLKRTYGLGAQQQAAVKNAMAGAFSSVGIPTSGTTPYSGDMNFPDFSNVGDALQSDNVAAANRLDPLFNLGLFKSDYRNASFHELIGKSSVLDLSQIPSDEIKNALAELIVLSAHAYYNSQEHSGSIRQVLVFDEAHRVLESEYMLKLVRECRAYGVATLLSSQYPSDFPGEISASMATKVVHGNGGDIDRVKSIVQMIGCEGREGDVANLDRFQAFVDNRHHPRTRVRTMNYPLYLVWGKLKEVGSATRDELARVDGLDTSKLPMGYLVRQLERLGLAEEREGRVYLLEAST